MTPAAASGAEGAGGGRALVIELCGLPGAGKSHVAALLRGRLEARGCVPVPSNEAVGPGVPAATRLGRKLAAGLAQTLSRPGSSVRAASTLARAQPPSDAVSRSLQWLVTQRMLERARSRPGIHLLDEGLMQSLWSAGLRGDAGPLLALLDAHAVDWARPDVVVAVRAPIGVVLHRLDARASAHSRTQALAPPAREAELRRGEALLGELLEWIDVAAEAVVLEVDNGDDGAAPVLDAVVDDLVARFTARRRRDLDH